MNPTAQELRVTKNADLEAVATGIHEGRSIREPGWNDPQYEEMPGDYINNCRKDARAALLADPVRAELLRATQAMIDACGEALAGNEWESDLTVAINDAATAIKRANEQVKP